MAEGLARRATTTTTEHPGRGVGEGWGALRAPGGAHVPGPDMRKRPTNPERVDGALGALARVASPSPW